jgi:sporulation protein YlmC with PRC-barrel domain
MGKPISSLISMAVFSIAEGQKLGRVKAAVIDPGQKAVRALLVESSRWRNDTRSFVLKISTALATT